MSIISVLRNYTNLLNTYNTQSVYPVEYVAVHTLLFVPPTDLEAPGQPWDNDPMLLALSSADIPWIRTEQRTVFPLYTIPARVWWQYFLMHALPPSVCLEKSG